ncbi:MAG TPA: hypothetical protein VMN99_00485 [Anaerolineales bacterium]|nr:hypothetical protein [Anaerolineales bacterium]
MTVLTRLLIIFVLILGLAGCTSIPPTNDTSANACPLTEPLWIKPPIDAAVLDSPTFGFYFVNQDSSILASALWADPEETYLRAGGEGVKVGWFRPAGVPLKITGQRLDGQAPPFEAQVPCCYPTRFQATGLYFPTEGCWEVTAKAADSELSFVVWVKPE